MLMSELTAFSMPEDGPRLKAEALALLARVEVTTGHRVLRQAAAMLPNDPEVAFQLGNLALRSGALAEAIGHYRRARGLAPGVAAVHNNLATALLQSGEPALAQESATAGLAIDPKNAQLHNTVGNIAAARRDLDAALASYERALACDATMHKAAVNRANVLRDLGALDAAESAYGAVLATCPEDADAHCGLALLCQEGGRHDAAITGFRRALAIDPRHRAALNNLAISLLALGKRHDALAIYRELARFDPGLAEAHGNLAQVLQGLGRHDEAVAAFRRALALKPDYDAILPYLAQSLMHQCAWSELPDLTTLILTQAQSRLDAGEPLSLPPFAIVGSEASPALRLGVAKAYAERCAATVAPLVDNVCFSYRRDRRSKLRVGYISPDFRNHSVGLSVGAVIAAHGRDDFAWYGYSVARERDDEETATYRRLFDRFVPLPDGDVAAGAKCINDDGIDVLVDLAGHTRDSALEILALRPAPVQIHYFGYANTLGADWIPYLITDETHTPPELARYCSETLIYLPNSFMAAGKTALPDAIPSRDAVGLPGEGFVFVNFNGLYKFDAPTFEIWMRLLQQVNDSVLWLKGGSDTAVGNLRRFAAARGVDPARLVFAARCDHAAHLSRHRLADLALDTLHHTGGVTTLDALWAGVPVVTVAGATPAARTGASILSAIGLGDLAPPSEDAYEETALRLARDPQALRELKMRLAENRATHPLFDAKALAGQLQTAYRLAWEQWADGLPRETIRVQR